LFILFSWDGKSLHRTGDLYGNRRIVEKRMLNDTGATGPQIGGYGCLVVANASDEAQSRDTDSARHGIM
jgi:hypothetical protein